MSMIQVKEIDIELDGKKILQGVSLKVKEGDKIAVFGESGSGKTSLLRSLIGLLRPSKGTIEIGGYALNPNNLNEIRSKVFYMPQEVRPVFEETVKEFIEAFFSFKATRENRPSDEAVFEVFDSLRLDRSLVEARMSTLSGGERQRVGLARGLLLGRELMLLDEVTSAVDIENRDSIVDLLMNLESTTIVAVTHDPRLMDQADEMVEISKGRVV